MSAAAFEKTIFAHANATPHVNGEFGGPLNIVGRILDAVKSILANLPGTLTPDLKAQLETAACSVFDTLVVLPEPFDALSDMLFKSALDKILGV